MPTAGETHDLVLESGSVIYGYMLARDKGRPMWQVGYAPNLSPQMFTAEASYANSPPSIEKVTAQDDWRKGMGEEKYDDPKRYAKSIGADARFKGLIVLGPLEYTLTTVAAGAPALQNPGFESQTYAWRAAQGTFTTQSSVKQAGTYAAEVTGGANLDGIRQLIWMPCSINGQTVTFTIYGRTDTVGRTLAVQLYEDGVYKNEGTTAMTLADTWYQASVSYTGVSSTTSYLEVLARMSGGTYGNFYLDTATLTFSGSVAGPALGNPKQFLEFNSKLYMLSDTGLWEFDSATPDWHWVVASPGNGERMEAWGDYLFIARGETRAWWAWDKYGFRRYGTSYGTDTAIGTDGYANFLLTIGASLYKAYKPYTIAAATVPLTGTWTSTTVGESGYNITGLTSHRSTPYIGKENALYKLTDSTATEIAPELRSLYNTASGKNLKEWKGYLYVPMGGQALYQYDGGADSLGTVSPAETSPGIQEYSGQIEALAGDEGYLYAFVTGLANKCELLAGRYENIDGSTGWVWHPIYELAAASVETAYISSITSPPRLWFITTTSVKYLIGTSSYADILQATGYKYATSGTFETGNDAFGFIDQLKAASSLTMYSKNFGVGTYTVAVTFQDDDDGTWSTLGTFDTSPSQTKYFPADTTFKRLKLKFALATTSADYTPQIKGYALHGLVAWTRKRFFTFTVKITDNLRLLNGNAEETPQQMLAGRLKYFGDQHYVTMKVLEETTLGVEEEKTYYVRFMDMQETATYDEKDKRWDRVFNISAVEVKLS